MTSFTANVLFAGASVKQFAFGSAAAFSVYVVGHGLAFITQLLIARTLGAESYGIYAYVVAWMSLLSYVCALGFNVALVRFVPIYLAAQTWAMLRGVIQYAERRVALVSITLIALGIAVIQIRGPALPLDLKNSFLIGFILVPLWALLWVRCAIVRGLGGIVWALIPVRIVREGLLLIFVCATLLGLSSVVGAPLMMTATVASSAVALVVATLAIHRLRPRAIKDVVADYRADTWRQAALPLLVVTATEALFNKTGVLILGWLSETKDAGIYALVFNMALLVVLPRTAVNTIFAPTVSRLYAQKKYSELQVLTARAAALSLSTAVCIAIAIAVLAKPVLGWFGQEFVAGVLPLHILLIGQLFAASTGSQLQVMAMTGHERGAAKILVASAVASAVICVLFVNLFGLIGAAIATTTALIIWNTAMALFIWRNLKLRPGVLGIFRFS